MSYPDKPLLRVRLTNTRLKRLLITTQGTPVTVQPSPFGGLGLFCLKFIRAHNVVCYFRGAALDQKYINELDSVARIHHGRYMICSDTGMCCVPLRKDTDTHPPRLPDFLSGCLINEACSRPEGEYEANVYVVPTGGISAEVCPWLGRRFFDWEVRASRDLVPGEELLLCYGALYSSRHGYQAAKSCDSI